MSESRMKKEDDFNCNMFNIFLHSPRNMDKENDKILDTHTEYMKSFHEWQRTCNFYYSLYLNYCGMQMIKLHRPHQQYSNTICHSTAGNRTHSTVHSQDPAHHTIQPLNHRKEYKIAPIHMRVLAEVVDFLILLLLKLLGSLLIMKMTGYSEITIQYLTTEELLEGESSLEDLQYMIAVALIYRIFACFYEAMFVCLKGFTPGKSLCGLRIVSCQDCSQVQHQGNVLISVYPGGNPSLVSSWARSLIKNFSLAFFMPAFFTIFFYQFNRASYDIVANTIVVEEEANLQ